MSGHFDVAVVGAGIVGLAHAWIAARQGRRVLLLERQQQAQGASVRNFGMIWPIGQTAGARRATALRSRDLWLEAAESAGFVANPVGSLHLAYRQDELAVLEQFQTQHGDEFGVKLLSAGEVTRRSPMARTDGIKAGLWSDMEVGVNPGAAIHSMPGWLSEQYGVELCFGTSVVQVDHPALRAADGHEWSADHIVVCSGQDLQTLFPDTFRQLGVVPCKLQMMQTVDQPADWQPGPLLAGGLTLQHYQSFADCPALDVLRQRIDRETPEINRYGIHVLAAQHPGSSAVTLGDSHVYGDEIDFFHQSDIDDIVIRELRKLIELPRWKISRRWSGVYATLPDADRFVAEPQPGVHVVVAAGGAGMTMSFSQAEQLWQDWG